MANQHAISLRINGRDITAHVEPRWTLAEFLRDHARLTGTHIGCDTSQCGACTVHVDGMALKSCTFFAVQANGAEVTTIEGVAPGTTLHPMQAAFQEHHALQCGFCTPGMIMSALDLVRRQGTELQPDRIASELDGNICRCTGYYNIITAIGAGAASMKNSG
jgi:aerobic carbon-monoxide dehydrogenase small subunit